MVMENQPETITVDEALRFDEMYAEAVLEMARKPLKTHGGKKVSKTPLLEAI
jgi:hypothetical protein